MKALITGASSGLGREITKLLANTYDELVVVARTESKLIELKEEIAKFSKSEVKIVVMDVSIKENCQRLYEENKNVDLLVNNAGFGDYGEFTETSLDKELTMINTNIVAYHILTKLYLTDMMKANKGHILNVASIAGFMPGPLMATYYATKSYVVRLSQAIREELRRSKSKVKISILCPGPVNTNFKNTANIKFNFYGADCKSVAKYTVKHLKRFYIVPRIEVRLSRLPLKFLPSSFVARVIYAVQNSRRKNNR